MNTKFVHIWLKKTLFTGTLICALLFMYAFPVLSENNIPALPSLPGLPYIDTVKLNQRIYSLSGEMRSGFVMGTDKFLRGSSAKGEHIKYTSNVYLKFGFRTYPGSWIDRVFGSPYQGIGFGYNMFGNTTELGNPWSVYVFQGGHIRHITNRVCLWYEWNFGIASNWKHFKPHTNPYNLVIGSKMSAYMNGSLYLNWEPSNRVDVRVGVALSHFSNGNTHEPNRGLNTITGLVGVNYYINNINERRSYLIGVGVEPYDRRWMYEVTLFAATVQKTLVIKREPLQAYKTKKYNVQGTTLAAIYSFNHRFRAGFNVDITRDESRNATYRLVKKEFTTYMADKADQWAIGCAGRVDYVMPYFTLSGSLGYDVFRNSGNDARFYQTVTLKMDVVKGAFINVGYRLQNFQRPNFLMLGVGYLFRSDNYPKHR
ncbi:MAG: acyloxyacyl hydrolase [Marinifilaceae bacterium]